MQPGKRGQLQARQRGISARSTPFFAPATILCQLPLRPPECSGLRLHHSLESRGGRLGLRTGSLGHSSSCCRESRWQWSKAMWLQYWAQHPHQAMYMFNFSCRDNSAISTVIIYCNFDTTSLELRHNFARTSWQLARTSKQLRSNFMATTIQHT